MSQSAAQTRTTWDTILSEIRKEVNPHSFETWLRPTRQERLEQGTLVVTVPSPDFEHVKEKFGPQIERAIQRLNLGVDVRIIRFHAPTARPAPPMPSPRATPARQSHLDFESVANTLNPRYTFDNFVVGASNQFAHAAALAVSERLSRAYNPLFLYGGVGMGKTHLMQAIAHKIKQVHPESRIEYATAEKFTNDLIGRLRSGSEQMITFRDYYRSKDVLLVDDIQFIANKERTQEEFFHTFNALHGDGRLIVLSSDRPPKELVQLEERLRSRFEWGLIADIQQPDLETKIAILMQKAQAEKQLNPSTPELPQEVAEFIAGKNRSNVRELEGALIRLLAYCSLKGLQVTIPVAQEALKNIIDQQERKVEIETILRAVAELYGVRPADLKARDNSQRVARPRQVVMYVARKMTGASLSEIARFFNKKDHSTVIYSIAKVEKMRSTDKDLDREINCLIEHLR
jgi:chromosomal replication initiator protein